jgi:hypothetical protein
VSGAEFFIGHIAVGNLPTDSVAEVAGPHMADTGIVPENRFVAKSSGIGFFKDETVKFFSDSGPMSIHWAVK